MSQVSSRRVVYSNVNVCVRANNYHDFELDARKLTKLEHIMFHKDSHAAALLVNSTFLPVRCTLLQQLEPFVCYTGDTELSQTDSSTI